VVTPYNVIYDGNAHTAAGTATGVIGENLGGELDLSGTSHTDAGTYDGDVRRFAGDNNYNAASGTVDDAIAKANAAIAVTPYNVIYDGNAHTATGTATGVIGENLASELNLSGTTHTDAGTYNGDVWSFAGDKNYNAAMGTVDDAIAKASPGLSGITVGTSDPMIGAQTVVLGTAGSFIASATLSGGANETGTITFTLLAPNGSTAYSDVVAVSGDGAYDSGMAGVTTRRATEI
jgi:hypothetical protein